MSTDPAAAPASSTRARWAALAVVVLAGNLVVASWRAHGQAPLWVVHAGPEARSVVVDDGEPAGCPPGATCLRVREGARTLRWTDAGGRARALEASVARGALERLLDDGPVVVVDLDAAGDEGLGAGPPAGNALLVEEASYGDARPPRAPELHFGQARYDLPALDDAFAPFPEQATGGREGALRRRVVALTGTPARVLERLPAELPTARALDYAEHHLARAARGARGPEADALVRRYAARATADEHRARRRAALEGLLAARPAWVAAWRTWQEDLRAAGEEEAARTRTEGALAEAPDDPGLLYLAGRMAPDAALAAARYRTAVDRAAGAGADGAGADRGVLGWASHALAALAFARGDLEPALEASARATAALPDEGEVAALHDQVRLARGDLGPLVRDLEEALQRRPRDLNAQRRLLEALATRDGPADPALDRAHARFVEAGRLGGGGDGAGPDPLAALSAVALADLRGDVAGLRARAGDLPPSAVRALVTVQAALEAGTPGEAEGLLVGPLAREGRHALLVALAWSRAGDAAQAAAWRARAADAYAGAGGRGARVGALLRAPGPPAPADLEAPGLPPAEGVALRLALAAAHPAARADLVAGARGLPRGLLFPGRWLAATADDLLAAGDALR